MCPNLACNCKQVFFNHSLSTVDMKMPKRKFSVKTRNDKLKTPTDIEKRLTNKAVSLTHTGRLTQFRRWLKIREFFFFIHAVSNFPLVESLYL